MTVVDGDVGVTFWIATKFRCRGERHFFSCIAPLYHIMLCVKKEGIKHNFLVYGNLDLGLKPGFPGHWGILYPLDDGIVCSESYEILNPPNYGLNSGPSVFLER